MASGDNNEVDESLNSRSEKKQDIASEKQLSKVDLFLKCNYKHASYSILINRLSFNV